MWLSRIRAANTARLLHRDLRLVAQNRGLKVTPSVTAWLSKKESKAKGEEAPVGNYTGAIDNPVWHTNQTSAILETDKHKEVYYRERPDHDLYYDKLMVTFIGTVFWGWFFYHLYYDYQMITGHFYMPYLSEWTDEELGIPPDNAPDPEYWGNHGKRYGTYR